jgi:hypothetical protein
MLSQSNGIALVQRRSSFVSYFVSGVFRFLCRLGMFAFVHAFVARLTTFHANNNEFVHILLFCRRLIVVWRLVKNERGVVICRQFIVVLAPHQRYNRFNRATTLFFQSISIYHFADQ